MDRYIVALSFDSFECWADSPAHAEEQAIAAYPNLKIAMVGKTDDQYDAAAWTHPYYEYHGD